MSRELTKMNLIAIVQQLPEEDIEVVQVYIGMIERENKLLKRNCNIGNENLDFYRKECKKLKNNWNKLKEWLKDDFYWGYYEEDLSSGWVVEIVKDKMQEIEGETNAR